MQTKITNKLLHIEIDRTDMLNCRCDIDNLRLFKLDDDYAMMVLVRRLPLSGVKQIIASCDNLLDQKQ